MAENNIIDDLQGSSGEALLELFELQLNGSVTLYFHPGTNENYENLIFDGNTYVALPIQLEGIDIVSDGANSRPSLTIANVTNVFKSTLSDNNFRMDDLVGKRFTRRRTLEKYLGTPAQVFEFPTASYIIDRIAGENNLAVEFELASPFDVEGVQLPSRVIVGKYCSWIYQGRAVKDCGGCSWLADSSFRAEAEGPIYQAFFDMDDKPIIPGEVNSLTPPNPVPENWQYIVPSEGTWPTWSESAGVYSLDDLVTYQGKNWRSDYDFNNSTPGSSSWTEILLYTDWDTNTTYSVGEHVKHTVNDIVVIWKSTVESTGQEPYFGSPYWTRADSCSKTLGGCKSRFQIRLVADTSIPSAAKNTRTPLPFGAFPGSVKFK